MPTNSTSPAAREAEQAKASLKDAARHAERSFIDATDQARDRLTEAAHRTETAVREGMETLKAQSRAYADTAGSQLEEAQRYVVGKVKERPVESALVTLGVGVVIGLLLASRSDRR